MEYTIEMIINEMKIIDINNDEYTVECIICHRQKIVSKSSLKKGKILFHKYCVQKEKPTNFYNIWLNYKKKQNCLFVDFYDKFYSFYLDLKQLEKLKIIPPIDEIRIERINNDYFLIPYNYKYSHRIYDSVIYEKDDYLDKFRKTWSSILGRITNKNNKDYKNYGG